MCDRITRFCDAQCEDVVDDRETHSVSCLLYRMILQLDTQTVTHKVSVQKPNVNWNNTMKKMNGTRTRTPSNNSEKNLNKTKTAISQCKRRLSVLLTCDTAHQNKKKLRSQHTTKRTKDNKKEQRYRWQTILTENYQNNDKNKRGQHCRTCNASIPMRWLLVVFVWPVRAPFTTSWRIDWHTSQFSTARLRARSSYCSWRLHSQYWKLLASFKNPCTCLRKAWSNKKSTRTFLIW